MELNGPLLSPLTPGTPPSSEADSPQNDDVFESSENASDLNRSNQSLGALNRSNQSLNARDSGTSEMFDSGAEDLAYTDLRHGSCNEPLLSSKSSLSKSSVMGSQSLKRLTGSSVSLSSQQSHSREDNNPVNAKKHKCRHGSKPDYPPETYVSRRDSLRKMDVKQDYSAVPQDDRCTDLETGVDHLGIGEKMPLCTKHTESKPRRPSKSTAV